MARVRTANLGGGEYNVAGAFTTLYTCPSDSRAVIKWWSYVSTAAAPGVAVLGVLRSGTIHGLLMYEAALPANTLRQQGPCYCVLDEGDQLVYYQASTTGGNVYPSAGGVEFDLP